MSLTITSFTPTSGPAGTSVTINGSGFNANPVYNQAIFPGGGIATAVSAAPDGTQIVVAVPGGVSGSGPLTVQNYITGDSGTSSQSWGAVTNPPTITGFAPSSGGPGSTVIITGTNFSSTPSANTVKVNGVTAVVTAASPTQLTAIVPDGASTGAISVQTANGTATSGSSFSVTAAVPRIDSLSPSAAAPGAAVIIAGANFSSTPASNTVDFNGTAATVTSATPTELIVTVPTVAGSGFVHVTVAGQTGISPSPFTVLGSLAPIINGFTPTAGPVGTTITITGSHFDPALVAQSNVKLGGLAMEVLQATTDSIIAVVPPGADSGPISVYTTAGGAGGSAGFFIVTSGVAPGANPPPPIINSFAPASGPVGAVLTINGTGFDPVINNNGVLISGIAAPVLSVNGSGTVITAVVPAGAATGPVAVVTGGGTASSAVNFVVTAGTTGSSSTIGVGPGITTFTPASGVVGSQVAIYGSGFDPTPSRNVVTINGVPAVVNSANSNALVVTVPAGASTGVIEVTTASGSAVSGSNFTVSTPPAPSIASLNPTSGTPGSALTINGANFDPNKTNNVVEINGVAATITSASASALVITVPTAATTGPVKVINGGGTATSGSNFTVSSPNTGSSPTNPPTISSFSPGSGAGGSQVVILGANFDPTAVNGITGADNTVTIGGIAAPVVSGNSDSLVVTIPANAISGTIAVTTSQGTAVSGSTFTVLLRGQGIVVPDSYTGAEDDGMMTPASLLPYLRALLKDTSDDIAQLGLTAPTWPDADLYRYLELARGEYTRQRPKRLRMLMVTTAAQQKYLAPAGAIAVDDVLWAPAGFDLDQISALAASLAGGSGLLWGGDVPIIGQIYFDSPASITVWNILREAWRNTFGGRWLPDGDGAFDLLPTPQDDGLFVLVFYRAERHWSDVPWYHRMFILATALLYAIRSLTTQVVAASPAQGQKLSVGLRGLAQMVEDQYRDALNIREPGLTAGRS